MHVRCPHCQNPIEVVRESSLDDVECPSCGSSFNLVHDPTVSYRQGFVESIGQFELVEQLGTGAFGTVWKARDTQLDRFVAVKVPRTEQLDTQETEKFLREARAAAQLRHPNIVSLYEVGQHEGTVYIVSDFVEGLTLADWLSGQRFSPHEAADLCLKIAEALQHAHEAGVVHRDLKPSNIMLAVGRSPEGSSKTSSASGLAVPEPYIMDFGLAKREAGEITMTVEGAVLGTPAYMSPEQASGSGHDADRRSDVYSLGVILFELLTGERPFRGNSRMLLHQVIHDEPPPPRKLNAAVPRDLETICLKCLEKEPEKRYATARDVAGDLKRFLDHEPIQARPVGRPERVWRWCRRNPRTAALSSLTAVLILVLAVGGHVIAARQAALRREAERFQHELVLTLRKVEQARQAERNAREEMKELSQALVESRIRIEEFEQKLQSVPEPQEPQPAPPHEAMAMDQFVKSVTELSQSPPYGAPPMLGD